MKAQAYPPIGDYALLSDCHSGALVSKDGSIDWCTFHRFEARPVFARLLDWGKGGFFRALGRDAQELPQAFSHLGVIQAAIALDQPDRSMTAIEVGAATAGP